MKAIHISTALHMLQSPEPLDLTIVTSKGEVRTYSGVIGLNAQHYAGTRNIKFTASGQIRKIRDCLILAVNGLPVFL